jgi:predicted LPLAT superfamily acyltransferase
MSEQTEEREESAAAWSGIAERGSVGALRFIRWFYTTFGRRATIAFLTPVVAYFFATGRAVRRASLDLPAHAVCRAGRTRGAREHRPPCATPTAICTSSPNSASTA